MKKVEIDRLDMPLNNDRNKMDDPSLSSLGPIELAGASINELWSDGDHSDVDLEEEYLDKLKEKNSSKNNRDVLSPNKTRLIKFIPVKKEIWT